MDLVKLAALDHRMIEHVDDGLVQRPMVTRSGGVPVGDAERRATGAGADEMGSHGLRGMAVAQRRVPADRADRSAEELFKDARDLELLALVRSSTRPEAARAIAVAGKRGSRCT